ncbi:MAG: hypothetical protein H0W84_07345 [Bacteroidetes bacterium]|nr:hypothetical protein [Bacteroidota bacterium]
MKETNYTPFILLFLVTFISRIPFLSAGYGVEEDSWGIALAAFHTHISGIYEPSRFPGHPVQELIYSALWGTGPFVFNILSAFFSAIGVLFFALILKHLQFKHFFIASLAFAFIPVYYISSTYTIDFAWTEAFILISFYYLLKNKLIHTGIFLGLAIGCRITSGAMLLPFMLIIWQQQNLKQNFIQFLKISIPVTLIVLLAFLPLIQQFGYAFLIYYDQFPYPPITKVFYKMTLGVFGFIGTIAIIIAIVTVLINRKKLEPGELYGFTLNKKIIIACFTAIALYVISYFRLPQKSGYMIVILPFMILLLGHYLNSRNFKLLCIAFILSSFCCSINLTDKLRGAEHSKYARSFTVSGQEIFFDPFSGPIFSDHSKRKQKMNYTKEVISKADTITSKTVIIAGWWYNEIMVEMINRDKNAMVVFEPYIDEKIINKYHSNGYQIFYLPEQNVYNDQMYQMQITDYFAKPF